MIFPGIASIQAGPFPNYDDGVALGTVTDDRIFEASGLAASRQNPGVFWTHNDNKTTAVLFAVSTNGNVLATFQVSNVFSGDFEDIAIGPGPRSDLQYIYFGDIGDNDLLWDFIRVVRVPEPAVYHYTSNAPPHRTLGGGEEIWLQYPDGRHDAETLMSDPVTGDLFIGTKDLVNTSCRLYRLSKAQLDSGGTNVLEFIRDVPFRGASAGDISVDGAEIVLRRGSRAELWQRTPGMTIGEALGTSSRTVPLIGNPVEPNGEAIGFHPTGLGYYTISEGLNQPVYFFPRTSPNPIAQPIVLFPATSTWTFFDFESVPLPGWMNPVYDDSGWRTGPGKLGYGQGDEQTLVDFGYDQDFKITTTFFRAHFHVGNPRDYADMTIRFLYSDGIALYLNGQEILRRQLNPGASPFEEAIASNEILETAWITVPLSADLLQPGTNTWAAELHRFNSFGPSMSFDLELSALPGAGSVTFSEAPAKVEGGWRLVLAGPSDANVEIEASTNLMNWTSLGDLILTNGSGVFLDSEDSEVSKFYRALIP